MTITKLKKRAAMVGMEVLDYQIGVGLRDNLYGDVVSFFWNTANEGRKVFRKHDALALADAIIEAYSRGWTPQPSAAREAGKVESE